MDSLEVTGQFLHLQDILGQMLMLRTCTQISLFFANEDESLVTAALDELKHGLARLAKHFPWLAGQVLIQRETDTSIGDALIVPCEQDIAFTVNDIRADPEMPSMSELVEANFPFRMLHRDKIAKAAGIGESFETRNGDPARVLTLQASIIRGGVVLTFAGIHHTMDMNGLGQVIYLFSKACRDEPFTTKEIEMGNCARKGVIPLLGEEYLPGPDVDHFILKPKAVASSTAERPESFSTVTWTYFTFSADKLRQLKERVSSQKITEYISTNDALSALIFRHVTRARASRSADLERGFNFRCVDGRKMFGVDKEYIGHMVAGTFHINEPVMDVPLDVLAGTLRQRMLDTPHIVHTIRALVTLLDRAEDKTTISYCPNVNPGKDIMMSSWAKVPSYDCDFGQLGKPDCARRARLATFEGVVYFMPKARDGEIAVALCLREDDIEALRHDQEFMTYAEYVG